MKKFTVKDFIAYNNPCFSCDSQISFNIGFSDSNLVNVSPSYLRPTVTSEYTEIDLSITYRNSIKLYIIHKNNKIVTTNHKGLSKYLENHSLFLYSVCNVCKTNIYSNSLIFQLEDMFVKTVGISYENLIVYDENNVYLIKSSFTDNKSVLMVTNYDKAMNKQQGNPFSLELSLLPKYKFKNKKHFLEKMKTYVLFS